MPKQTEKITMHYFNELRDAMGDQDVVQLPDKTNVRAFHGKADAILIKDTAKNREIDLSQGPDGEILEGIETRLLDAPHDDERDFIPAIRPFPQTEEDIRFMTDLAATIRAQRDH